MCSRSGSGAAAAGSCRECSARLIENAAESRLRCRHCRARRTVGARKSENVKGLSVAIFAEAGRNGCGAQAGDRFSCMVHSLVVAPSLDVYILSTQELFSKAASNSPTISSSMRVKAAEWALAAEAGTWREIWRGDRRIQGGCYGARSRSGNSIKGRWRLRRPVDGGLFVSSGPITVRLDSAGGPASAVSNLRPGRAVWVRPAALRLGRVPVCGLGAASVWASAVSGAALGRGGGVLLEVAGDRALLGGGDRSAAGGVQGGEGLVVEGPRAPR